MLNILDISKRIIITLMALMFFAVLVSFFIFQNMQDYLFFASGIVVGTAFAAIKLILIDKAVNKSVGMDKEQAFAYIGGQFLLRFIVTGAVLFALARVSNFLLFGAAAGLFFLQLSVYIVNIFFKEKEAEVKDLK